MLDDLIKERLKKLEEIKKVKLDPYPPEAKRTLAIAEARKRFNALAKSRKKISLVGRILGSRDQGNIVFLDLADATGKLQLVLKKDNLPDFEFWKSVLDIGDFIYAGGSLFKTKKGEEVWKLKSLKYWRNPCVRCRASGTGWKTLKRACGNDTWICL